MPHLLRRARGDPLHRRFERGSVGINGFDVSPPARPASAALPVTDGPG